MRSPTAGHNTAGTAATRTAMRGFSLAEVLAALTIGAMISVAVLGIYRRAERSAAAVIHKLDSSRLPDEILQRIAEDLDDVVSANSNVKMVIQNKLANVAGTGLVPAAKLTITETIEDNRNRELKFEEITWQSSYDYESPMDGLVLYRSHSGITSEDKVLDKNKEDWERELFVPICGGVTFFKIEGFTGNNRVERWNGPPPPGIIVTISFAEPSKKADGTFDVPEEQKIMRAIALDRTRKIRFQIAASEQSPGEEIQENAESPDGGGVRPATLKQTEKSTK
ncbi:MAG: prepilin-type N-terminal cleavage/methylation domain-containing protein [Planctomycetota bacterium]